MQAVSIARQVTLDENRIDGEKIGEFSVLVRDPDGEGVIAVSDRGYLAHLDLQIEDGRLTGVTPVRIDLLTDAEGNMRERHFDPEGATLLDDGTIAIVSENGPRLAVFDTDGRWLRDEPLPEPLQRAAKKDVIESLAMTPAAGFVAMTDEPQQGPRAVHQVHSTKAGSTSFTSTGDSVSVKADGGGGRDARPSRAHPRQGGGHADPLSADHGSARLPCTENCATTQVPIPVEGISNADFKGLVELKDNTFLMVSGDKIDGDLRSVFVMFQLG